MTWSTVWRRFGVEVICAGIAVFGWLTVARLWQDDQMLQADHQVLQAVVNALQQRGQPQAQVQPQPQPQPEAK